MINSPVETLENTVNFSFDLIPSEVIMHSLEKKEFMCQLVQHVEGQNVSRVTS